MPIKFVTAPEEHSNGIFAKLVSEDGKISMGVHPVMFGYRIRAGLNGVMWYEIDWCCGDKQESVEWVYTCVKTILESRDSENAFDGLYTHSDIKPLFKDIKFLNWMTGLIDEETLKKINAGETVKLEPLSEYKRKHISAVWQEN